MTGVQTCALPISPVRAAGVVVGRITGISLDPKSFQGVVTMEVSRNYQFPKDSSAKILTAGLLGDQYVGLEPGGEAENLAPGASVKQTQSAMVLENLIGQFLFNKAADVGGASGGAAGSAAGGAAGGGAASAADVGGKKP